MRVAQLSYSSVVGGASRAVRKLHEALLGEAVDGRLIVADRSGNDATDHPVSAAQGLLNTALAYADGGISLLQRPADRALRGVATLPTPLPARLGKEGVDVVNFHWVGLGTASIAQLGRITRALPTVWSLHDMWALSGAEFYGEDSSAPRRRDGYLTTNRAAGDRGLDIDRWVWNRKRKHFTAPVHLVTASRWMAGLASQSLLTQDWAVTVIPYSIDTQLFSPGASPVRAQHGLTSDDRVVLFGANKGPADPRKGWDLLVAALELAWQAGQRFHLAVFGRPDRSQDARFPFPIIWLGDIRGEDALANTYRMADLIAIPSRQDNLPLTGLEAQSCGIPVVAFDTAGMPDVAVHRETGYLATPFDSADLAQGISWILGDRGVGQALSQAARTRAESLWAPPVIARSYLDVYRAAMDSHRPERAAPGG